MFSRDYLLHISEEINFSRRSTTGIDFEHLMRDDVLQRALLRSLEVIGEAPRRFPQASASAIRKFRGERWLRLVTSSFMTTSALISFSSGILCRMRYRC